MSDRCPQREFLSRLLPAIVAATPALIVIDKTFDPVSSCAETPDLLKGFADTLALVPVIVAAATQSAPEAKKNGESDEVQHVLENARAVLRLDAFPFPPGVRDGIATLDIDERKIPLQWPVFPGEASLKEGKPVVEPSMALMAATAYDPTVASLPAIKSLESHRQFRMAEDDGA